MTTVDDSSTCFVLTGAQFSLDIENMLHLSGMTLFGSYVFTYLFIPTLYHLNSLQNRDILDSNGPR